MDVSLSPSCPTIIPSPKYMTLYLPSSSSGDGVKERVILEKIYANVSKILKRGYKVRGYKGVRLPICNINSGSNDVEVSDICDLPRLFEVKFERDITTAVYINLFIYTREDLMLPRVTAGSMWVCGAAVRGLMGVYGGHGIAHMDKER